MLKPGEKQKFKVARKTDIGYMLVNNDQEEVFLHNNETNYKSLVEGMKIEAFLFFDNKGRLAATLYEPIIKKDQSSWLKVTGVNYSVGVFLNNGINKDILYSKDDLPNNTDQWPQVDDLLYVKLQVGKNFLAINSGNRVLEDFEQGLLVEANVITINERGITLLTPNLTPIFVDVTSLRKTYRIGESAAVIINFKHDGYYSGQLIMKKEEQRLDDADLIFNYLESRGKMPLTSDSTPEEIKQIFNMSKKAFKRALGALYKQRKIDFIDGNTILKR